MKLRQALLTLIITLITLHAIASDDLTPTFRSFATTPPMGWNSWDCYASAVKENQIYANANYMAQHLLSYGWQYVVIDIRWYSDDTGRWYNQTNPRLTLDEWGRYTPDTLRFPSARGGVGFKAICDSLHRLGLKVGIHIMRGVPKKAVQQKLPIKGTPYNCSQIYTTDSLCTWLNDNYGVDCRKPGAQEYYNSLMDLYASWGIDFIKVDDLSRPYHIGETELIRKAIDQTGRPMVLSISPGQSPLSEWKHLQGHTNMWRMMDDLWDRWSDVLLEFDLAAKWNPYRREGNWPDCDMLPFGKLELTSSNPRWTNLTHNEQLTMMSLWSIFRSPLFFSGDFTYNDAWTDSLLTNADILHINQHSTDNRQVYNEGSKIVWAAREPDSDVRYAALFNVGSGDNWIRSNEALYSTETITKLTTGFGTQAEVDIPKGSKVLALVVDDAGDGYSYDHGDWIDPTVTLADGTRRQLTSADVLRTDCTGSFWKRVSWNKNIDNGGKMKIDGQAYDSGFSCNANVMVLFRLPDGARHFSGFCGLDDSGRLQNGATSSLKFMVFNEDPTKRDVCNPAYASANSGLISRTYQQDGVTLEADITGAKKLYLVVTNAGDNFNYDHADWINPTLIDDEGHETKLTTLKYTSSKTDWQNISNYGKNVDGGTLNVAGKNYADGIGTNSNSVITYDLPEGHRWVKFRSMVGYDYAMRTAPNGVTMEFLVYTSDPMGSDSTSVPLSFADLGLDKNVECEVYDIWGHRSLGTAIGEVSPLVANHGAVVLRLTPTGRIIDGINTPANHAAKGSQTTSAADGIYTLSGNRVGDIASRLPAGVYVKVKQHRSRKTVVK